MSVDGAIISDLRHVLSQKEPVPFFFLICGSTGSGKSTCLRAVRDGAAACCISVTYGAPVALKTAESEYETEWKDEKARIFVLDVNALRFFDADPAPTTESYPPGTVVFLDDIEAVDYVLRINASSHCLEKIVRLMRCSPRCALVTSATDVHCVPRWLTDIWTPLVYQLPELTPSAANRFLFSLTDADVFAACFANGCGKVHFPFLRTKRDFMLALCHARSAGIAARHTISSSAVNFIVQCPRPSQYSCSSVKLFGLEAVCERVQTMVKLCIGSNHAARRNSLSVAASATGILLHGPSGSGKTALVEGLEELCRGMFFFC